MVLINGAKSVGRIVGIGGKGGVGQVLGAVAVALLFRLFSARRPSQFPETDADDGADEGFNDGEVHGKGKAHYVVYDKPMVDALMVSPPSPSSVLEVILPIQNELKKIAANKAVEFVKSGMVLGLGTGSTAKHAVNRIGELLRQGKLQDIIGIPTSKMTHEQAISLGIPLSDLDSHPTIDLAIDGADEVDPYLNLVKGRGGSLLREKMVEGACKKFIVIVDESKLVKYLGGSELALPIEIVPFSWKFTADRLQTLFKEAGCIAKLRRYSENGDPFVTDNNNFIIDLYLKNDIGDLKAASLAILRLAGVVEHGMFIDMATTVIIAGERGITVMNKSEL